MLEQAAAQEPQSMRIYTKTGDDGSTGLFGGGRVAKDSLLVEAYGTVDELNSALGVARAARLSRENDALLLEVQGDLFCLGAELACAPEKRDKLPSRRLGELDVQRLELAIDQREALLPALHSFILPGGSGTAAALHLARTICRRAERRVRAAVRDHEQSPLLLVYLNRLADLLFVLARHENLLAGCEDVAWAPRAPEGD